MTLANRALRRPQSLWLRKALFQIHLWTGIGVGLYVVIISISGSAIVFRNEVYKNASYGPKLVPMSGPRLSKDQLKKAVHAEHPGYAISYIWESKRPNEATEVWIEKDGVKKPRTIGRLVDPFTGKDLGPSRPWIIGAVAWMGELHTNLLGGDTGRKVNGVLSVFVTALSATGLLIWWPGAGRVKRSLKIDFRSNWKRLNWDLHSVVGFWLFALVFMWGVTGIFLVFPRPFQIVVNHFSPLKVYTLVSYVEEPAAGAQMIRIADGGPAQPQPQRRRRRPPRGSNGDVFLRWFYYLHFGNFSDWGVKTLWVVLGLVPPFLFVTGAIMWWNRVLSREARASRQVRATAELRTVAS